MAMEFNVEPFWDDFESTNGAKDKNYMRILFRPGYAVQARELTQLQTIIQNQIKQFGDHIFKDGSPVYGGHITLDNSVNYVKLETAFNGVDIDLEDYDNRVVFNKVGSAKIRAKVVATDTTQTQPTLMIRYLRGTNFSNGTVLTTSSGSDGQVLTAANSVGFGSVASIGEGVFYVDGFFVKVDKQTIVLDAYTSAPSYKIGLEIDDEVMDESGDANLLDPAQESFNYQAPGAHRFRFALNLAKRALNSIDDQKFFELIRVENGLITKQVQYPIYSEIEKTLARRTYDESGDYTVNRFAISLSSNTACTDVFTVNIEPGKAYVKGFEFETFGTQKISVNKARTTNTATDYDLSLEYGNYLYANNVVGSANGLFDTSKLDQLELHCVPRANINITAAAGYGTTFMGTARIRDFIRDGQEYIVYLTDVQLTSNTVTALSTGTSTTIVFPAHYSATDNAYANVSVRVTSGNSSGDVKKIISYVGSTKTATVDTPFTGLVGATNTVALLYNTKDIDSLVEVISLKTALNVAMDVSSTSKSIANGTIIYDSNKNSLLFKLPESYIANGTIVNADFVHRKFIEDKTFTSNGQVALTLTGNETYNYGSDGSLLSATTANNNLIVMVKDKLASNTTNGTIINLTAAGSGVKRDSSTQLTIFAGANQTGHTSSNSFIGDIYVTVKVNDSESTNKRTKTIKGNVSNTTVLATDVYTHGTGVTGNSTIYIDSSNGHIWFTDTAQINKTPGGNNSLYIPDVYKIVKIYDSGNTSTAVSSSAATDITNRYYLDSGQNLGYYDHSKIILKPGASAPRGQLLVKVEYYEHSGTNGYFNTDSYPIAHYTNGTIPIYQDQNGEKYNLRDCIDFRPSRTQGTTANTFIGAKIPKADEPMELTYAYYVPRIDKVILTKDRELKTLTGIATKFPGEPLDSEGAMTLYKLSIPAYTPNPAAIIVEQMDNRRFTMKDIGNIEARIKNIEYYTALTFTDKKAKDSTLLYEDNATEKEKYGIVTDNFSGFKVADSRASDFICAVDGALVPYNEIKNVDLVVRTVGNGLQRNDKTISLSYTEQVIVSQLSATANISIQPYLYGKFDGSLRLTPATDSWFSVIIPPIASSPGSILPDVLPPVQSANTPSSEIQDDPIVVRVNSVIVGSRQETNVTASVTTTGAFGNIPFKTLNSWLSIPPTPKQFLGNDQQFLGNDSWSARIDGGRVDLD